MSRKVFRGDRLKQLRESQNLTQADLMTALNINRGQIVRYESSLSMPPPHILSAIGRLLSCSVDYLLGLTDSPSETLDMASLSPLEKGLLKMLSRGNLIDKPDAE